VKQNNINFKHGILKFLQIQLPGLNIMQENQTTYDTSQLLNHNEDHETHERNGSEVCAQSKDWSNVCKMHV